jgi:hypothetical protein
MHRGEPNPIKTKGKIFMPPMDTVEIVIVCALFGALVLWFGIYLWHEMRGR